MSLHFQNRTIELTGKESELLYLLYSGANTTAERVLILKKVWDNDGDYIGRTLDVFISKLRKKLEEDSTVKILNIRGVGYKLVYSLARAETWHCPSLTSFKRLFHVQTSIIKFSIDYLKSSKLLDGDFTIQITGGRYPMPVQSTN